MKVKQEFREMGGAELFSLICLVSSAYQFILTLQEYQSCAEEISIEI